MDRFIGQLNKFTSLLKSFTQVLGHLFKAPNPKDARAYDALIEVEKQHKHFLGATRDKASPAEFVKYFDACVETLRTKHGKPRDQQFVTYYINIIPCGKETKAGVKLTNIVGPT